MRQSDESLPPAPTPGSFLDENSGLAGATALTDPGSIGRELSGQSGPPSPLPPRDTNHPSGPPLISDSDRRALRRLVDRAVPQDELISVIGTIVSNVKAANIVTELKGNDAQTFADIIDEACHHVIPSLKNQFVDLRFNFPILVVRRWVASISQHESERNA